MIRFRSAGLAMVVLLGVIASSCAAPSLSAAEYAAALQEDTDSYILEAQRLSLSFQRTVEDEITVLAASGEEDVLSQATDVTSRETVQYLALLEDAMMRYQVALVALKAPSALVEPHDAYVLAIESVQMSLPATRDAIGRAGDLNAIQVAITGSGFNDGQLRLRAACSSLEAAVRAEGHGVDLGCVRPPAVGVGP
jgi:hypothetical protein